MLSVYPSPSHPSKSPVTRPDTRSTDCAETATCVSAQWRPRAKAHGTRMVDVAPPARPAPPGEVRELGTAGLAVARRGEAHAEGHRRGRGHRLEGVSGHASPPGENAPRIPKPGRGNTSGGRQSASPPPPDGLPRPRSVDAPLLELHDRHSTAVLATSSGAPPAASGTTWSTVRSEARWAGRL